MSCYWCSQYGFWICDESTNGPDPCSTILWAHGAAPAAYKYRGRFRIQPGKWQVWSKKNGDISISACKPDGNNWESVGCVDFDDAAYDVFSRGGDSHDVRIQPVYDQCGECDDDEDTPCTDESAGQYVGRFRISQGRWKVWCKNDGGVSVSACEPGALYGNLDWSEVCCFDFDPAGDYDIWVKPGANCSVRIEAVGDECGECIPNVTASKT